MKFVAVDFETANQDKASVCEVGLVRVESGIITDSLSFLVRPPADKSDFFWKNVQIHGIRETDVIDAPTFDLIAQDVFDFIGDAVVVAHNSASDIGNFRSLISEYSLENLNNRVLCTKQVSEALLESGPFGLSDICRQLDLDDFNAHRALADAKASAKILLELARRHSIQEIGEFFNLPKVSSRSISGDLSAATGAARRQKPRVDEYLDYRNNSSKNTFENSDLGLQIVGSKIVVTGTMTSMSREEAEECIRNLGGEPLGSVSRKVAFVVAGPGAGSKLKKALQMEIPVIDEETFLRLVSGA